MGRSLVVPVHHAVPVTRTRSHDLTSTLSTFVTLTSVAFRHHLAACQMNLVQEQVVTESDGARSCSGGGSLPALANLVNEGLETDALSRAFPTAVKEGDHRSLVEVRPHGGQER